jgi:hypothetical protein
MIKVWIGNIHFEVYAMIKVWIGNIDLENYFNVIL